MTPAFTNKHRNRKLKRYFYYRCTSTQKYDWNNCSVKQVSADRLENFVLDNLKRIALDTTYLDSFIFTLNHKLSGHGGGLELQDTDFKFSAETTRNLIISALKTAKETKGIERNLQIRKYIEGISYSPEEIRLNLFYSPENFGKDKFLPEQKETISDEGQGRQPVLRAGKTGCLPENFTPSWGAGDRGNGAGNCEPADKERALSGDGRSARALMKMVRSDYDGCTENFPKTITFILPNTIHKSKKKDLRK